jgi:hypothetical protein
MPEPRTPQDHKKKKTVVKREAHPDEPFEFEHDGEIFRLAAATKILSTKFARLNRNKSEIDQLFTMIEALADKPALDAIDDMMSDEFEEWTRDFYAHVGVELGE